MNGETKPKPLRIFLYSHPRTRSNLLIRLLESHPKVTEMQYPFMDAYAFGPDRQETRTSKRDFKICARGEEEFTKEYAGVTYQTGLDKMEEIIAKAESEGQLPIIKEHVYHMIDSTTINSHLKAPRGAPPRPVMIDRELDITEITKTDIGTPSLPVPNPTMLPDRLFASLSPLLIIRHPAYTLPSFMRASSSFGASLFEDDFQVVASFRWQRLVHDCYVAYYKSTGSDHSPWPVVIDGDKLVNDPKGQMTKICEILGLDEAGIRYSWDKGASTQDKTVDAFLGDLLKSTGVVRNPEKSDPPVISELTKKWAAEWDENQANKLTEYVESAMEDYKYLLKFSL